MGVRGKVLLGKLMGRNSMGKRVKKGAMQIGIMKSNFAHYRVG